MQNAQNFTANPMGLVPDPNKNPRNSKNPINKSKTSKHIYIYIYIYIYIITPDQPPLRPIMLLFFIYFSIYDGVDPTAYSGEPVA